MPLTLYVLSVAGRRCPASPWRSTCPACVHCNDLRGGRHRARDLFLGANDQLLIRVADAPDLGSQPIRIDPAGDIRLPMVGTVRAAGKTIEELEAEPIAQASRSTSRNPISRCP